MFVVMHSQNRVALDEQAEALESKLKKQSGKHRRNMISARRSGGDPPPMAEVTPRPQPAQQVKVTVVRDQNPQDVLDMLAAQEMKPGPDQMRQVRQVIQNFENLYDIGDPALPYIAKLLTTSREVTYDENLREISSSMRDGQMVTDFLLPPSLRMGLYNTVRRIGGREAEMALAESLQYAQRGVEVAYLGRALERMAAERFTKTYLPVVLDRTKTLLKEPPVEDQKSQSAGRLDKQHRNYLWGVMRQHKDDSLVDLAETQLMVTRKSRGRDGKVQVDKEGKEIEYKSFDNAVMGYLTTVLGDRIMPMLSELYDQPDLGDRNRSTIRQVAATHMGTNPIANKIVNSRIAESLQLLATTGEKQRENRGRGIGTINYYLSRLGGGRNVEATTLNARKQYLVSLRAQTTDKEILTMMDKVDQRLTDMADPEKAKKMSSRFDARPERRR